MKINAVRVREVGCFADAVAIEGLSPGLNVLSGANEAGKSTLLKALRLAFEEKHTSKKAERLRPYGGGAPLIEVEFDCGGRSWLLRKQYLTGRMAELHDVTAGLLWRGADAEEQLADLVAQGHGLPLALLWAGQKEALAPLPPSDDAQLTLRRSIAAEVETTTDGNEARDVRIAVRRELAQYLTDHRGGGRPKGEYDAALRQCDNIGSALNTALDRERLARQRLDRLAECVVRADELGDPIRLAAQTQARDVAHAALTAARDSIGKQRAAEDAANAAEAKLALLRAQAQTLSGDLQALAALQDGASGDADKARELASASTDAEAAAAEARARRDEARAALAALSQELKAAMDAERRDEARQRLAGVTAQLDEANAALQQGLALRQRLEACLVNDEAVQQIRAATDAVQRAEDRLSAAAPQVTVAYVPGARARIVHAGAAMPDGEAVLVEQPLVLEIEGVGTITIAPGGATDLKAVRTGLDKQIATLTQLLKAAGVDSLEAADTALRQRRLIEAELVEARSRFAALAPSGVAALQAEVANLTVRAGRPEEDEGDGERVHRDRDAVEAELAAVKAAAVSTEAADEAALRTFAQAREGSARHAAAQAGRVQRMAELESKLPAVAQRDIERERLADLVRRAEADMHAAVREYTAWRSQAPDAVAMRALETAAEHAARLVRDDERLRDDVARTIAGLEGELRADRHDDVEARVAQLDGELVAARARVKRFEDDIAALQLLDQELQAEEERSRDQYLKPVTERLQPYVQLVFPGARTAVSENFTPAELQRDDAESVGALSEGTQEQLAVLVRLAFGRLLAEAGQPVPVILDDALVYSDDERILRMFGALEAAARHHQVIILTCRARTFADLAGQRLQLQPWTAAGATGNSPALVAAGGSRRKSA